MAKIIATILAAVVLAVLVFMSKKDTTPVEQIAGPLSSTQAVEKVKNRPEVKKYLSEILSARVDFNGTDGDLYLIQAYEIKDGHTATFNWYQVNKKTGIVKAEFEVPEEVIY